MMQHHRKQAKRQINRLGLPCEILRKTGATTNRFGKKTGASWEPVQKEYGVLNRGRGRSTQQMYVSGGELDQDAPFLTLAYDTVAEDGDRVEIEGVTYEIQTLVPYPTHKSASLVSVNGEL